MWKLKKKTYLQSILKIVIKKCQEITNAWDIFNLKKKKALERWVIHHSIWLHSKKINEEMNLCVVLTKNYVYVYVYWVKEWKILSERATSKGIILAETHMLTLLKMQELCIYFRIAKHSVK